MIKLGYQEKLYLGNLNAKRDWGYAPEYCEGMWRMLQHKKADDYVLATGETHTVKEYCEKAFQELGITIEWTGNEEKEKGIDPKTGNVIIEVDPNYYRPTEVDILIGDASKAKKELGWEPKVTFDELIKIMIKYDFQKIQKRGY